MKTATTYTILALAAASCNSAAAFSPNTDSKHTGVVPTSTMPESTTTSLSATSSNRRDMLVNAAGLIGIAATTTIAGVPLTANAEARPMYLTEPTDEFKASEAKAMEFKRQQLAVKKEFATVLEKFLADADDGDVLEKDLRQLKALIAKNGGLPLGIKKDEVFKIIRSKKAKGFWPTPVEIAYQSLQQEIKFQQSPNLDKELGNPYQ